MGKIGLIIIIAAIAAYAADQRWNDSRYTDSTAAVLRHAQRALGL
jgi:endo-1,4-beta-D-glucanase Y